MVGFDEARQAREQRREELRSAHPSARYLGHVLDDHAHRRTGTGELACGAPVGALIAADPKTPLCERCFPSG